MILLGMLAFAGCVSKKAHDGPPRSGSAQPSQLPPDAVPRKEPRSRYGNPATYDVFGVRYEVMQTSYGYKERGVASWYGKKFHGRMTSSQEPYNMYAMTAAHKTLPLPTYVRVRNLKNNRSIVVRVNDRGPFVDNRIIDLSYSAATKTGHDRQRHKPRGDYGAELRQAARSGATGRTDAHRDGRAAAG
jgi:rare lipoprotein A